MNWLDYAILAVIALSALISVIRGFVREFLSLVVWIAAFWIALRFAEPLSLHLDDYIASPSIRLVAAFAALFVTTLLVGALLNFLVGQLVGKTGLSGTDRFLGIFFGIARGLLVVAILVLAAGLTALPRESWWQESLMVKQIQPWVCRIGVQEWMEGRMVYSPLNSDAEGLEGTPAPEYWQDFCEDQVAEDEDGA